MSFLGARLQSHACLSSLRAAQIAIGSMVCLYWSSSALATSYPTHFLTVRFENSGVALSAEARDQFHREIRALPHGGWCPGVLVTALVSSIRSNSAEASGGTNLNRQRLQYVLGLLELDGVPRELVQQAEESIDRCSCRSDLALQAVVTIGVTGPLNLLGRCEGDGPIR